MAARPSDSRLLLRWLWVAYLPLILLAVVVGLRLGGVVGRETALPALVLVVWAGMALRLIIERRRRGVKVPIPRSLVTWLTVPPGIAVVGLILFWVGAERLSTNSGFRTFAAGVFLMALSVMLYFFKAIDSLLRAAGRALIGITYGRRKRPAPAPEAPRARPPSDAPDLPKVAEAGRR